MTQRTMVVTLRLSAKEARCLAAVQGLTGLDEGTMLRGFIEDGLRKRVLELYREDSITAQRGADSLGVPLHDFLGLLEKNGIAVNWDKDLVREYVAKHERESLCE